MLGVRVCVRVVGIMYASRTDSHVRCECVVTRLSLAVTVWWYVLYECMVVYECPSFGFPLVGGCSFDPTFESPPRPSFTGACGPADGGAGAV